MGISNPTMEIKNPAKQFIEWKPSENCFLYYDKEAESNFKFEFNSPFIPLEWLHSFKGLYKYGAGKTDVKRIQSQDVKNKYKDIYKVSFYKSKKSELFIEGTFNEIWEKVKAKGAKQVHVIYAYYQGEIINIKLPGSAGKAWMEFCYSSPYSIANNDVVGIQMIESKSDTAATGTYYIPQFKERANIKKETLDLAIEKDKELQKYLSAYFAKHSNTAINDDVLSSDDVEAINSLKNTADHPQLPPPIEVQVSENMGVEDDLPF